MADTQSSSSEDVTMQVPHIEFFKTLINVFKENRELLSNLPEVMECLLDNGPAKLVEVHQFEEYRKAREEEIMVKEKRFEETVKVIEQSCQEKELKMQELERGLSKREEEITRRENEIMETAKQGEDSRCKMELELQKVKEEISKNQQEITKREKKITEKEKKCEEVYRKRESELQEAKEEFLKRKEEITKREKERLEREKKREDDFRKMERELQKAEEEIAEREKEKTKREKEILDTEKQHGEAISKLREELKKAQTKTDGYASRLASISERRVKQDQRKVEDTLSSNRQSDLEKDFSSFFDEDRLDACEKMLSIFQKEEDEFNYIHYPRLACIILEAAYEQVKEVRNGCVDLFKELTKVMVENAAQMGTFVVTNRKLFREGKGSGDPFQFTFKARIMEEPTKFPKNAMDGLLLSLKENAERCFLDKLMEGFLDKVVMKWNKWYEEDKSCLFTPSYQLLENLDQYIKACLRLSWRIVTQVPPMNLEYQTLKLDINIHKKLGYHDRFKGREKSRPSAQENQKDIACYLWPGLQDGGGRVIRAGEVLCVIPEEENSGNPASERKRQ